MLANVLCANMRFWRVRHKHRAGLITARPGLQQPGFQLENSAQMTV